MPVLTSTALRSLVLAGAGLSLFACSTNDGDICDTEPNAPECNELGTEDSDLVEDSGLTPTDEPIPTDTGTPEEELPVFFGDFTLETASDIAILAQFGQIAGNLTIRGDEIVSLEGLENLKSVDGYLAIIDTTNLTSLAGLDNLERVNFSLYVETNAELTSIEALDTLLSVGASVTIEENPKLVSAAGLENLTSVTIIRIYNNDSMTDLTGLNNITQAEEILVFDNASLNSLEGLGALTTVDRDVQIYANPELCRSTVLEFVDGITISGSSYTYDNDEDC